MSVAQERLLGVETEYALSARGPGGAPLETETALMPLIALAKQTLRHLPDIHSGGLFLENSARLYIDSGMHPELSTPECCDPGDVVRYIVAGERTLARLAAELTINSPGISEVTLLKCNVDYSGTHSTWGCHESYLHRADLAILAEQIVPHLVSRVVYTGAGGFNTVSPKSEFLLSPRVPHLVKTQSSASTHDRGIFHTKNESLCAGGYHRLHVLCGESLCSELATWIKLGATGLVVAMTEAGLRPGNAVRLASPLSAIRRFARDETCTAAVRTADKKTRTALAIQRHYQELAARHVAEPFMPSWAPEVVAAWGALLDRLAEGAPDSVSTVLDWAIKLALYRDRARRRGRNWIGLKPPEELVNELYEIDARFGQLGGHAIFTAMDRAGVLDHHVARIDRIEQALHDPPPDGRARVRGDCIKRLAGQSSRYAADWHGIWDSQTNKRLDLSDPFETRERWVSTEVPKRPPGRHTLQELLGALRPERRGRMTPEGYRVGALVALISPETISDENDDCAVAERNAAAECFIGRPATITNIVHFDRQVGCSLVRVDIDGGRWIWPTRTLRPAPDPAEVPF